MKGIKIKIDNGNVSIDITKVKDKLIEKDSYHLLIEHINEALSDEDFAECNQINPTMDRGDLWVSGGLMGVTAQVFFLGNREIIQLKENGKTTLQIGGGLEEYIDTSKENDIDFLKWFYSTNDVQEAVQMLYEDCGWVVTDIDTFQARKELVKDAVYQFRENRYRPNIGDDADNPTQSYMYEDTLNYEDIDNDDLMNACYDFGYSEKQVEEWMANDQEIPLMLECYFETV
jgi:hypothetical protein